MVLALCRGVGGLLLKNFFSMSAGDMVIIFVVFMGTL